MIALTVLVGLVGSVLLTIAGVWGLFHPRQVLAHRTLALRDAFWMTVVFFFSARGLIQYAQQRSTINLNSLFANFLAPFTSGALCVLVFPLLFILNLHLIALARMRFPHAPRAALSVLPLFWGTLSVGVGIDLLLGRFGWWPRAFASAGSPLWSLLLLHQLQKRDLDTDQLAQQLTSLLHRKCTLGRGKRKRDVRGVVLGLLAGVLVLLTPRILLLPYQGAAYASAIQLGQQLQTLNSVSSSLSIFDGANVQFDRTRRVPFQDILVVKFDPEALHQAHLPTSSEAGVQTQLVNALAKANVAGIVLPVPPHDPQELPPMQSTLESPLREADLKRNTDAYPALGAAIRAAGRVYLSTTPLTKTPLLLRKSARGEAGLVIRPLGSLEIPVLNLVEKSSLPHLLVGDTLPHHPGQVLIDFRTDIRGIHPPLFVSQILHNEEIYEPQSGRWVPPRALLAKQLVLVEPLAPQLQATPLGPRTETEVLAQAVASLRARPRFVPIPLWIEWALVLGLTMLCGHLSVGRAPLESVWRITLPILVAVGACIGTTAFWTYCADPVLPTVGAFLAFLMVTQFTFAVERGERERNRQVLRRFLAPQVIEQMVDDPETKLGLGGTRRPVVVLFADVRGFSGFAEKHTPEEVVAVMNRYLAAMTDALNDHEGILDKYTGDGLMALFPVEDEPRDVLRAVRAAVAMARAVERQGAITGETPLAVGLGLHYGEAVVGLVGHPTRQVNYTALGHTVVVAARLQTYAQGGEVILSEAVVSALNLPLTAEESVTVKGVAQPVPLYRVKSAEPTILPEE